MVKRLDKIPRFVLELGLEEITNSAQIQQIKEVLRLKTKDLIIGIWQNQEHLLKLGEFSKNTIKLLYQESIGQNNELSFELTVGIPLLKGDKNDLVLQKITELGVQKIQLLEFKHSVKKFVNWQHKKQRWYKIIKEAVEQSERQNLPILYPPINLAQLNLKQEQEGFVFMERIQKTNYLIQSLSRSNAKTKYLVFGPEGGFSKEEKSLLLQKNFQALSLGQRILRSETAIIAGTALFTLIPT